MSFRIAITAIVPPLAVLLASPMLAIEAPPDDAPPPPEPAPAKDAGAGAPGEMEIAPRAYIGVVAEMVPDMLAAHLDLGPDRGIVLRAVMPDSPAAKAGLEIHDVITRVAGEPVGSSDDLTTRIIARQPGDVVQLDLIRRAKPLQLDVTLENRPADLAGPEIRPLDQLNLDGIPADFADRVRKMIEGNMGERVFEFGEGMHDVAPEIDQAMREMRDRMRQAVEGMPAPQFDEPNGGIRIHQGATIRLMDDEGSVEMKSLEGGREITVRDPQGNITWTGPWDTEQDKAGAPEDVRRRIERLNIDDQANGLRLKWRRGGLGGFAAPADP